MNPEKFSTRSAETTLSILINELSRVTSVDFDRYKKNFLQRQIRRQVCKNRLLDSHEYLERIRNHTDTAKDLINRLNVHVTCFFRDASLFQLLEEDLFPRLWKRHINRGSREFRIWIIGCATGEEAYSVAISFLESISPDLSSHAVQIFGTDLDEVVVDHGRKGEFPSKSLEHLNDGLRNKYFLPEKKYKVVPELRRLITFGTHDLLKDPFIHHLDMIFCRNVLIFLDRNAQDHVCRKFHQALNPDGILVLGRAESPTRGFQNNGFVTLSRRNRVYQKTEIHVETAKHERRQEGRI